jgi:hypothetical protein
MEYRSRRERREAERAGLLPSEGTAEVKSHPAESSTKTVTNEVSKSESRFPSRRELRKRNGSSSTAEPEQANDQPPSFDQYEEVEPESKPQDNFEAKEEVNLSSEIEAESQPLTAKSYIYQESSNTVTIDSIPDSLSTDNGDLLLTNSESIEVVTGSHSSMSAVMDDLKYDSEDQKDTVTGRISLVDPVSAKLVADSREPEIIVPGKIVVKNRAVSITFAVLGGVMFVLAGIGLWWALSEMGPFSS